MGIERRYVGAPFCLLSFPLPAVSCINSPSLPSRWVRCGGAARCPREGGAPISPRRCAPVRGPKATAAPPRRDGAAVQPQLLLPRPRGLVYQRPPPPRLTCPHLDRDRHKALPVHLQQRMHRLELRLIRGPGKRGQGREEGPGQGGGAREEGPGKGGGFRAGRVPLSVLGEVVQLRFVCGAGLVVEVVTATQRGASPMCGVAANPGCPTGKGGS
jgi:hypothetical protein